MDKSLVGIIIAAVVGVLTGIGRFVWKMSSAWLTAWIQKHKDDREAAAKERAEDRALAKEQITAQVTLSMRLEGVEKALGRVETRVERVSGVHDVPIEATEAELGEQRTRTATPAKGVGVHSWARARTEPQR